MYEISRCTAVSGERRSFFFLQDERTRLLDSVRGEEFGKIEISVPQGIEKKIAIKPLNKKKICGAWILLKHF